MMEFNKIVIVTLCDGYTKSLANLLSQSLDMMFCDTKELVEYELVDKDAIEKLCTKEYLEKSEKKAVKHIASFDNVVVAINYDYLVRHYNLLKDSCLIIYLKLPQNFVREHGNAIDRLVFDDRDVDLKNLANIILNVKKVDIEFVCDKVVKKIGEYYETCK